MLDGADTLDVGGTVDEKEIENVEAADTEQVYELGYLLSPSLSEESVLEEVKHIHSCITERSGTVVGEGHPKFVQLAYRMEKTVAHKKQVFETAFFGWIRYAASPAHAEDIARLLKDKEHLVRFLLVKSALDTPLPSRTPRAVAPKRKPEVPQTLDEAALERELEGLLKE